MDVQAAIDAPRMFYRRRDDRGRARRSGCDDRGAEGARPQRRAASRAARRRTGDRHRLGARRADRRLRSAQGRLRARVLGPRAEHAPVRDRLGHRPINRNRLLGLGAPARAGLRRLHLRRDQVRHERRRGVARWLRRRVRSVAAASIAIRARARRFRGSASGARLVSAARRWRPTNSRLRYAWPPPVSKRDKRPLLRLEVATGVPLRFPKSGSCDFWVDCQILKDFQTDWATSRA